ncbi:hypothetical protein IGI04_034576 [Brassica rapa subsp. trilocularis]|uniref:Uncharacterized protein n=1 Tax=Brassica rapa subsp. trilocularis TaxID=1813537 RepID=A0ABQ7LD11_BRACM|nr:hypothetical protein IGI04_034576 [Brassica rapa subsp. trilocularis]
MINLKSNMGLRGIMEINAKIANRLVINDCFHIIQPKTFDSLLRTVSRLKVDSLIDHLPSLIRYLITQGSYQPQQNPSSGSSAPQESSTDTLLKQILESQTRSEKHVGYELKNLHTKIDGSYNELNNKFSHLASTVLECHMEFLGTFGCIWSLKDVKQVIIGRAEHGSEVPQRRHEVARVSMARRHEAKPGATSQSDLPRSLPIQSDPLERHTKVARDLSPGDTKNRPWSDFPERHLQVAPRYFAAENHDFLRTFLQFILDSNHNASSELATQKLILRHFSPESALISLRTGSTIFYTTTFVLGALKTPNIRKRTSDEASMQHRIIYRG